MPFVNGTFIDGMFIDGTLVDVAMKWAIATDAEAFRRSGNS